MTTPPKQYTDRRRFITSAATSSTLALSLSGCLDSLGSGSSPPERQISLEAYALEAWPRPHRTPANDRVVGSSGPQTAPSTAWTSQTRTPVTALVVADGTVFAAGRGSITAFDADTGDRAWGLDLEPESGPERRLEVVTGRLYYSDRQRIVAVETDTQRELWEYEASAPIAELLELEGTVYVAGQNGLIGLNADTGRQEWGLEPPTHSRLAAADGTLYWLNALELAVLEPAVWGSSSGREPERVNRWTWEGTQLPVSPVVVDGIAYAGRDGRAGHVPLRRFDRELGHLYPEQTGPVASRVGVPAVDPAAEMAYVSGTEHAGDPDSGVVVGVDLSGGSIQWRRRLEGSVGPVIVTDELVFVAVDRADEQVVALERGDGADRWQQRVPVGSDTGPPPLTLVGDRLYCGTGEGVVAFDQ